MSILVINGANLNMLGIREPGIYGNQTYQDLVDLIRKYCEGKGVTVDFYQSNHEGDLVNAVHNAWRAQIKGIVLNAGAYTHTSIALLDAIKATSIPTVEVHITKVEERESFRQVSYIKEACIATVSGKGLNGYLEAVDILLEHIK